MIIRAVICLLRRINRLSLFLNNNVLNFQEVEGFIDHYHKTLNKQQKLLEGDLILIYCAFIVVSTCSGNYCVLIETMIAFFVLENIKIFVIGTY